MTIEEIRKGAPPEATHYSKSIDLGCVYLRAESRGYVCPYSGLKISEYDLHVLDIKPL